eukprot:TRINITY_DN38033_c0_g1_i1.p1 TRINITY_DN38033_c0_g1~~TRINITY_DN38033_c0_g1_i1.p1  ORF type:complete len:447 (-),score=109.67 TRINITY_DN38033_c0_g1_i1:112-1452(-)
MSQAGGASSSSSPAPACEDAASSSMSNLPGMAVGLLADDASRPTGMDVGDALCKRLLTPEFFEKVWEKRPLHVRRKDQPGDAVSNLLPEALSPDDLFLGMLHGEESLIMMRKGERHRAKNFVQAYLDGSSLTVNNADVYVPAIYGMCRALADRFFYHVFAVTYLTPPSSFAVRMHNDDQDVICLQVWGRKHWKVLNNPTKKPIFTEEMVGKEQPVDPQQIGDVELEVTMEPGDILYIPRGHLHEASTSGTEPSLHVTVTMPTCDYCWGVNLVKFFHGEYLNGRSAPEQASRPIAGPGAMDDAALEAFLASAMEDLQGRLSHEAIVEAFSRRLGATNQRQEAQHRQCVEGSQRPELTEKSFVHLAAGVNCQVDEVGTGAVFGRVTAQGPQYMQLEIGASTADLLRALSSKPQLVHELPGVDRFERLCVLHRLLWHGVLEVQPNGVAA